MKFPKVILNAAMTVDGKISTKAGDSKISSQEDLDRTHRLRGEVDAIVVGIGTVLSDDPKLTVRRADGENPVRAVVDSKGRVPSEAKILDDSAPTIVAVSEKAEESEKERLRSKKAEVFTAGDNQVDLEELMGFLADRGCESVLLEGGSTLNWGMLEEGLVDEVRVAMSPRIVGGEKAKTLVGGAGFERISEGVRLSLKDTKEIGDNILLVFEVEDS